MTEGSAGVRMTQRYLDERHGFTLGVPEGWSIQRGVAGLLVAFAMDGEGESFRPNLNVVRRARDRTGDLDELAQETIRSLRRLLSDLLLIDLDAAVVSDLPARRILIAFRQGIFSVTSEQWIVPSADHVWTVSAAASTEHWDDCADVFAAMVAGFKVASV